MVERRSGLEGAHRHRVAPLSQDGRTERDRAVSRLRSRRNPGVSKTEKGTRDRAREGWSGLCLTFLSMSHLILARHLGASYSCHDNTRQGGMPFDA